MKFHPGDCFQSNDTKACGQVIRTSYNSMHRSSEYIVVWDHSPTKEHAYNSDDVDLVWEHLPQVSSGPYMIQLPRAVDQINLNITIDTSGARAGCGHSWKTYNSGFQCFEYCEHCNEEKHEN